MASIPVSLPESLQNARESFNHDETQFTQILLPKDGARK